jgi:hypothetical protein
MTKVDTTSDQDRHDSVIPGSEELDQMGDEGGEGRKGRQEGRIEAD